MPDDETDDAVAAAHEWHEEGRRLGFVVDFAFTDLERAAIHAEIDWILTGVALDFDVPRRRTAYMLLDRRHTAAKQSEPSS